MQGAKRCKLIICFEALLNISHVSDGRCCDQSTEWRDVVDSVCALLRENKTLQTQAAYTAPESKYQEHICIDQAGHWFSLYISQLK